MSNWLHDLYDTMKRSEKEIALQQRIFREEPDRERAVYFRNTSLQFRDHRPWNQYDLLRREFCPGFQAEFPVGQIRQGIL